MIISLVMPHAPYGPAEHRWLRHTLKRHGGAQEHPQEHRQAAREDCGKSQRHDGSVSYECFGLSASGFEPFG
jgi:hypothetical protein